MTPTERRERGYDKYVLADLEAISKRAESIYTRKHPYGIPWASLSDGIQRTYEERAARDLWEEGALRFDPSLPYYEATYDHQQEGRPHGR